MTDSTPQGAAHVTDVRINAAWTKLIVDKKLKRALEPRIERLAQLKTSGERRLATDTEGAGSGGGWRRG
ncbi:hypothetical protein [Rhodococcus globerulus]|uniref:hypothetical protein n=1 Tax=Rhodococcus globerulus TaxID=33008 RepID=UPI001F2BEF7C|nr:hypothetical protein [Rhodococcus globerulus]MCE4267264.1 hypothetical protein [Rhodococcus globerulus]